MYKEAKLMFMYAETSVHVGGGVSVGAIDLAIAREKFTNYPSIPSSGVKGAIRSWFNQKKEPQDTINTIFGPEKDASDHAGAVVFTDARILLFPIKSFKGVFAWVTSPFVLQRYLRDAQVTSNTMPVPRVSNPEQGKAFVTKGSACVLDGKLVLEEYALDASEQLDPSVVDLMQKALPEDDVYDAWRERMSSHLVLLNDDDFREFVSSSTEVQTRIRIDSATKTVQSGALFYQENLPSETMLYTVIASSDPFRGHEEVKKAEDVINVLNVMNGQRIQFGGNESIGKGIFSIKMV